MVFDLENDMTPQQIIDFQRLKDNVARLLYQMSFHKHQLSDNTQLIPPIYKRIQLIDQAVLNTSANLGNHFFVTLGGNRTLDIPIGMQGGQRVIWEFIQDGTGSRTITLNSVFNHGAFTITLTTAANKRDFMEAVYSAVDKKWYIINFVKGY